MPSLDSPGSIITALVVALLGGGGFVSLIDWIRNRGKSRADVTVALSTAAKDMVEMLQNAANEAQVDANEARKAAREARTEAEQTRQQMHEIRQEMEMMAYRFRRLTTAILDDDVTRDDLKIMVRAPKLKGAD